jgi:TRAP-type C4-dicarboxylate transport system permease small subunit
MAERTELISDRLAVVLAVILAVVTIAGWSAIAGPERRMAEGITLAIIAAIYIGFALAERDARNLGIEVVFAVMIIAVVFVGLSGSRYWIAGGLAAHGAWDLLHHPRHHVIGTEELPRWYPPACLVVDFPLAAFVALAG